MTAATDAMDAVSAAVDRLLAVSWEAESDADVVALLGRFEVMKRRLPAVDHALVHQVESRALPAARLCRSTAVFLRAELRLSPREAAARVRAAHDLGPRQALSGPDLDPLLPVVAAAQRAGAVSAEHARIIATTLDALPAAVCAEVGEQVEQALTHHAHNLDPVLLAHTARRLTDTLDPDGTLTEDHDHHRRRALTVHQHPDGSGTLVAHLTPTCLARVHAVLDALAAPQPSSDSGPDTRTPAQRRHDALDHMCRRLLAGGRLPSTGGIPATVLLTLTLDQLESRLGHATTTHGGTLTIPAALALAAEAEVVPLVLSSRGAVLHLGRTRRLATAAQRLALTTRDGGCSFPGCDAPPRWNEVHHIHHWARGGSTDIATMTNLCPYHHDNAERQGWTPRMINSIPHWIPPSHVDPTRTPRRNHSQPRAA